RPHGRMGLGQAPADAFHIGLAVADPVSGAGDQRLVAQLDRIAEAATLRPPPGRLALDAKAVGLELPGCACALYDSVAPGWQEISRGIAAPGKEEGLAPGRGAPSRRTAPGRSHGRGSSTGSGAGRRSGWGTVNSAARPAGRPGLTSSAAAGSLPRTTAGFS